MSAGTSDANARFQGKMLLANIPAMAWVNPEFKLDNYGAVSLRPVMENLTTAIVNDFKHRIVFFSRSCKDARVIFAMLARGTLASYPVLDLRYITAPRLQQLLEMPEGEFGYREACNMDILFIDDVGAEPLSTLFIDLLFQRYLEMRPTVLSHYGLGKAVPLPECLLGANEIASGNGMFQTYQFSQKANP